MSREARGKIPIAQNCPRRRGRGLDSIVIEFTKNHLIKRSLVRHASASALEWRRSFDEQNER
jgi:hypothetical protein